MPNHVGERDRGRLIRQPSVGEKTHGGYARGVNHAGNAFLARDAQQFTRTRHVGGVHLFRISDPKPVIGRHMHDRITTGNGAAQRFHLQQIAGDCFGGEPGEIFELAGRADEDA